MTSETSKGTETKSGSGRTALIIGCAVLAVVVGGISGFLIIKKKAKK